MLPVYRKVRADRHKVARNVAAWGKNWQGWHYGFKLHVAIDQNDKLAAIYFTPANESDVLQLKKLVNATTRIVVGDASYTAQVTRRHLWRDYHCVVISPPRPKQIWLMAKWQHLLLTMRPKIEAAFGKLKTKHFLVTSFPRSVQGNGMTFEELQKKYPLHYCFNSGLEWKLERTTKRGNRVMCGVCVEAYDSLDGFGDGKAYAYNVTAIVRPHGEVAQYTVVYDEWDY